VFKINNAGATIKNKSVTGDYLEATTVIFTRSLAWPRNGNSLPAAGVVSYLVLYARIRTYYTATKYRTCAVSQRRGKKYMVACTGLKHLHGHYRLITIPIRRHNVSLVVSFTNMMLTSISMSMPYSLSIRKFMPPRRTQVGNDY
jgi:hypothetical protein